MTIQWARSDASREVATSLIALSLILPLFDRFETSYYLVEIALRALRLCAT